MAAHPPIKLNGVVLPSHMIAAEAQHHPASTPAAAFQAAARALIVRTLLLEDAKHRGLQAEPRFLAPGKRELDDEALIRALIEERAPMPAPEESECRAFYDAAPGRFRAGDLFEVSHILFAAHPHNADGYKAAAAKALAAIEELRKAPERFETVARTQSDCESRGNGGRLGQIRRGEMVPEFEQGFSALQEGEIAPQPVKTRFGAHVVRLDARAPGRVLPFEYVQTEIASYLAEQRWRRDVARYIDELIGKAEIEGLAFSRSSLAEGKAA